MTRRSYRVTYEAHHCVGPTERWIDPELKGMRVVDVSRALDYFQD